MNYVFLDLGRDWAIGYDHLQWIVYRRRKRQEESYWNPVGYVGSTRNVLQRVLRENHARLDKGAGEAIDRLPYSFSDWYAAHSSMSQEGRKDVEE